MMAESVVLTGFKELDTKLLGLSEKIAKNCLRVGVYAGARVIQIEAKRLAPIYTGKVEEGHPPAGQLKRDLILKHAVESSNMIQQTYLITVKQGKKYKTVVNSHVVYLNAFYAKWVENGHWYVSENKLTKVNRHGTTVIGHWAEHRAIAKTGTNAKWVQAHPFMRPAFDSKSTEAIQAVKDRLGKAIEDEAKK